MRAGRLNRRVRFERAVRDGDGAGGASVTWTHFLTAWGALAPERGRERVAAGRIESAAAGTLTIRYSEAAAGITPADRATIDGVPWNIRSIANEDQRRKSLTMVVERGNAT